MKTKYDYENEITELLDNALNELKPDSFKMLLDNIQMIIEDYIDDTAED